MGDAYDDLISSVGGAGASGATGDAYDQLIGEIEIAKSNEWRPEKSLLHLGAGAVEGTAGTLSMAADLFGAITRGPEVSFNADGKMDYTFFPNSKRVESALEEVLPEADPNYRYARRIGSFAGPGGALGGAAKGLKALGKTGPLIEWLASQAGITSLGRDALSGGGAELAQEVTGDDKIAPLVAAAGVSVVPSLFGSALKAGRQWLRGATPQEVRGSAALAQGELTGLQPQQIEQALTNRPQDTLGKLMTTAEITDNAGMAQIEKTLSNADEPARIYNQRANLRSQARDDILDSMSATKAINHEGLGTSLINKAKDVEAQMAIEEQKIWSAVPRYAKVDVGETQAELKGLLNLRQGGLEPGSKVRTLVDQVLDPELGKVRTSGMLQDIRSDALALSRDANLTPFEGRVLTALQSEIDTAMGKSLKGEDYDLWSEARRATAQNREVFSRGTSGGSLTADTTRPSNALQNALKGDSRSIKEIKAAVREDPLVIEDVKRGVIDMLPRDANGALTAHKTKNFIQANEGALKELFGDEHYGNWNRILGDLQSEAKVGQSAFRSSKGGSVTSQRETVAGIVQDTLLGSLIPGSGVIAKLAEGIKNTTGIRDAKSVQELLFRAAMEPEFALELSKTPTTTRILTVLETLSDAVKNVVGNAARASALEGVSRDTSSVEQLGQKVQGLLDRGARSSQPGGQQEQGSRPPTLPTSAIDGPLEFRNSSSQNSASDLTTTQPSASEDLFKPVSYQGRSAVSDLFGDGESMGQESAPRIDHLVRAVIQQESGGDPKAVSEVGAQGLMQVMPETAKDIARDLGVEEYDLHDPETNKLFGTYYLNKLIKEFDGDVELALTAYHSGPGRVKKLLERTGGSTLADIMEHLGPVGQKYARSVLRRMEPTQI